MVSIFSDMVKDTIDIFVVDFSIIGDFFMIVLHSHASIKVLWGVEFGTKLAEVSFYGLKSFYAWYKISVKWIEVDQAKIEVISIHPPRSPLKESIVS